MGNLSDYPDGGLHKPTTADTFASLAPSTPFPESTRLHFPDTKKVDTPRRPQRIDLFMRHNQLILSEGGREVGVVPYFTNGMVQINCTRVTRDAWLFIDGQWPQSGPGLTLAGVGWAIATILGFTLLYVLTHSH